MANPLSQIDHRPWPLPSGMWVMHQRWLELLFAHWPVSPDILRPYIPPGLELDTYDGEAWIGVVPFRMENVRPRFLPPVPRLSDFGELNVRTYVTTQGKGGVWFLSLDAANPIAVQIARSMFHLPYFYSKTRCDKQPDSAVEYDHVRVHKGAPEAVFRGSYRPVGAVYHSTPGTLESWLTERYCLYSEHQGKIYRGEIHHPPWPLQPAEAQIDTNSMAASHGVALPDVPPLLHYADRIDVVVWPIRVV